MLQDAHRGYLAIAVTYHARPVDSKTGKPSRLPRLLSGAVLTTEQGNPTSRTYLNRLIGGLTSFGVSAIMKALTTQLHTLMQVSKQVFTGSVVDPLLLRNCTADARVKPNYWRYGHSQPTYSSYPAGHRRVKVQAGDDIRISATS